MRRAATQRMQLFLHISPGGEFLSEIDEDFYNVHYAPHINQIKIY